MRSLPDLPHDLAPVVARIGAALQQVDEVFVKELASDLPPVAELVAHVEHYRGKMLRPTLALLSSMAVSGGGAVSPAAVTLGAVVEMVHMATLVHDDVLDEADVRRRGATVNRLRGNEAAVILGDYLIASSFHLCSTLPSPRYAIDVARAAAVLCAGELLQLHHRDQLSLDEPTYFEIVGRKTGELVAVSCSLGAMAGGASEEVMAAMHRYGHALGIAFQIQDDLLDLTGTEAVVGKSVRKDIEKGKMTLPLIHHLATASPLQRGRSLVLLEAASEHPERADQAAAELVNALSSTASLAYAQSVAQRMVADARRFLEALPSSPARSVLEHLAMAVITRDA